MPLPFTDIRTSHAISIKVQDRTIGRIQSWAPSQSRDVKPKYEINAVGTGAPIEHVPGIATTQTIQIVRYDLYVKKMEEIWGMPKPLWALTDQHNPIDIEETWLRMGGSNEQPFMATGLGAGVSKLLGSSAAPGVLSGGVGFAFGGLGQENELEGIDTGILPKGNEITVEKFWYSGCWFTSLGRSMQARGDRIVSVNATLAFTKVRPLL